MFGEVKVELVSAPQSDQASCHTYTHALDKVTGHSIISSDKMMKAIYFPEIWIWISQ
jgi:hypothetical protein